VLGLRHGLHLIEDSPRVAGRCDVCGASLVMREDDTEQALAVRLAEYHEKTNPVLDIFARKEYVLTVDARPEPELIQQEIRKHLDLPSYQPAKDE
jgi:adenylate kinase